MMVVVPYCHLDLIQARNLLSWIRELDPLIKDHSLILLASSQISQGDIDENHRLGKEAFQNVISIKQRTPDERPWPKASNTMFRLAYDWLKENRNTQPFLWLEPDAIPMVAGWLDT